MLLTLRWPFLPAEASGVFFFVGCACWADDGTNELTRRQRTDCEYLQVRLNSLTGYRTRVRAEQCTAPQLAEVFESLRQAYVATQCQRCHEQQE